MINTFGTKTCFLLECDLSKNLNEKKQRGKIAN